jgi:hypothetical protein
MEASEEEFYAAFRTVSSGASPGRELTTQVGLLFVTTQTGEPLA